MSDIRVVEGGRSGNKCLHVVLPVFPDGSPSYRHFVFVLGIDFRFFMTILVSSHNQRNTNFMNSPFSSSSM